VRSPATCWALQSPQPFGDRTSGAKPPATLSAIPRPFAICTAQLQLSGLRNAGQRTTYWRHPTPSSCLRGRPHYKDGRLSCPIARTTWMSGSPAYPLVDEPVRRSLAGADDSTPGRHPGYPYRLEPSRVKADAQAGSRPSKSCRLGASQARTDRTDAHHSDHCLRGRPHHEGRISTAGKLPPMKARKDCMF
jgi:hypothetical protein